MSEQHHSNAYLRQTCARRVLQQQLGEADVARCAGSKESDARPVPVDEVREHREADDGAQRVARCGAQLAAVLNHSVEEAAAEAGENHLRGLGLQSVIASLGENRKSRNLSSSMAFSPSMPSSTVAFTTSRTPQ